MAENVACGCVDALPRAEVVTLARVNRESKKNKNETQTGKLL